MDCNCTVLHVYGFKYRSYCSEHHDNLPEKIVSDRRLKCPICDDPVVVKSPEDMQVVVGLCCKRGTFHKMCTQVGSSFLANLFSPIICFL